MYRRSANNRLHAMNANRILTDAQIAQFRRAGLVFLPGFYDAAETREITAWVDEVAAWPEAPGRHMVYHEDSLTAPGERIVQRIEDVTPFHAGLKDLFTRGPMIEAVARLLGEPAVLFKDKVNFKLPGGEGFEAHQDVQAGWDAYASLYITAMVSIDETTEATVRAWQEVLPQCAGDDPRVDPTGAQPLDQLLHVLLVTADCGRVLDECVDDPQDSCQARRDNWRLSKAE
ncbi:MAG: hypothetical protein IH805_02360 [Proteobacteria bacterium]|nr:hypothetical protein [Pseudomonadota bacterium]